MEDLWKASVKPVKKGLKQMGHSIEATALGIHHNVRHATEALVVPGKSVHFDEPPEVVGSVEYANSKGKPAPASAAAPASAVGNAISGPSRLDAVRIPAGQEWSTRSLPLQPGAGAETPWWSLGSQDTYLCIGVREASNLPIVDYDSRSTSPYVRITLGEAEGGKSPFFEVQTRCCHRNKNPLWEQSFFFPLARLTPDTRFCCAVWGKAKVVEHFSGHVNTTLGHLLEPAAGLMEPFSTRYRLTRKRTSDRVSGDILLTVTVLPKYIFDMVHFSEDPGTLLDPQMLQTLLARYVLKVTFNEVRLLKTTKDDLLSRGELSISMRVGRKQVTVPCKAKNVKTTTEGNVKVLTFDIDEKTHLRMAGVFDMSYKWNTTRKLKDEVGDIKVKLMLGREVLCKTQVPVWDVPLSADDVALGPGAAADGRKTESTAVSGASNTDPPSECPKTNSYLGNFNVLIRDIYATPGGPGGAGAGPTTPTLGSSPPGAGPGLSIVSAPVAVTSARPSCSGSVTPPRPMPPARSATPEVLGAKAGNAAGTAGTSPSGGASLEAQVSSQSAPAMPPIESQPTGLAEAAGSDAPLISGLAIMRNNLRKTKGPYRYTRTMETYSELLVGNMELDMTMHFAFPSSKDDEAVCDNVVELEEPEADAEEAAEEGGEASVAVVPITAPAPLAVVVSEVSLAAKPLKLFATLFNEPAFQAKVAAREGLRESAVTPWGPDPDSSGQTRTATYIRPLSIPIPMAPKQCNVTEVHSVPVKEPGGFVLLKKVTTNAPKGDTFFVLLQFVGVADGPAKTRLRVSFKVEFVKSVGLLKGAVEGGAVSNTKELMKAWMDDVVKEVGTSVSSVTSASGRAGPLASQAGGLEAALATEPVSIAHQAAAGGGGSGGWVQWLVLLLVAALLVYLGSALLGVARALEQLAQAMQADQQRQQQSLSAAAPLPPSSLLLGEGGSVDDGAAAALEAARQLLQHLRGVSSRAAATAEHAWTQTSQDVAAAFQTEL